MVRSSKRPKTDAKAIVLETDDDFYGMIDGLTYNGLDLNKIRKKIYSKDITVEESCDDVVCMLMAYMMIGNNTAKLTDKITSKSIGESIKLKLRSYDVRQRPSSSETLTLPRIAIAFLPAYFLLRSFAESKLQKQTSSTIDVRFMDVAFCGVPEIWNKEGYSLFYSEFNNLISDPEKNVEDDDQIMLNSHSLTEDQMSWVEIAANGYKTDVKVKLIMERVMNINLENINSALIKKTVEDIFATILDEQLETEEVLKGSAEKMPSNKRSKKSKDAMEEGEIE